MNAQVFYSYFDMKHLKENKTLDKEYTVGDFQ
jgi:hypothetical protein